MQTNKLTSPSLFIIALITCLVLIPLKTSADQGYIHWPGTPYSPVWHKLYHDYDYLNDEKTKPIEFVLHYAPRTIDSIPVTVEATVSTFGDLTIPLPETWERVFTERGEKDVIRFTVTPPDNDTAGFQIDFVVGADTTNVYMTMVTATKFTYFYPNDPKWLHVDPAFYYDSQDDYFNAMEQVVDSAEKYPEDESLQREAKKAREAFGRLTVIPSTPTQQYSQGSGNDTLGSRTLEERQQHRKRSIEQKALTDSFFEIFDTKDMRYIRFEGEQKFSLLDSANTQRGANLGRAESVFLKLNNKQDIKIAARIVQRLSSNAISGNFTRQVQGTYPVNVSSETILRLQAAGIEMISEQEYHNQRIIVRLERKALSDAPFEIVELGDKRYIRFVGEQKLSLLDSANTQRGANLRHGEIVFLKLNNNQDIETAAKIVQRLSSKTVSGNSPSQVLGTYRISVSSETILRLRKAGIELITNQEYHRLLIDYEPPPDDSNTVTPN